ncbi:rab-GTPase-TBC domain-containing protein, partial [Dichotomocladium elegans]
RRVSGSVNDHLLLSDTHFLPRLEEENASMPPQDSSAFILAQIERQNVLLDEDPKSVCIQSNELKNHLSTMHHLIQDPLSADTGEEKIDWEFWSAVIEDFNAVAHKLPHLLSAKLKAGIPSKVRGVIWQAMSQSGSLHLETVYGQLIVEHSPYERIIQRDLSRTFPNIEMFKQEGGDGQQALQRVLTAYSLYDSHMPEQAAFCVFVRLMETYEMRTMFTLNMEGLQLRLYQFTALLAQILPKLSNHLAEHTVHPPMYASQWFLTLFAYAFPVPLVLRIYDIVFAEGAAETIMRVAIAILKRSEDKILQLTEFEDILDYVTSKLHLEYNNDAGQMINDAMELSSIITHEKMDQLSELYVRDLEQEKKQTEQVLAVRFNFWSRSEKKKKTSTASPAQQTAATSNRGTLTSVNDTSTPLSPALSQPQHILPHEDTAMLHQQIEDLLLALSQIQSEHLELKQDFVHLCMDKMDLEAERDNLKAIVDDYEPDLQAEVAKLKAANFELQQQNEELRYQNKMAKETQTELVEKLVNMKLKMDKLESQ